MMRYRSAFGDHRRFSGVETLAHKTNFMRKSIKKIVNVLEIIHLILEMIKYCHLI